MNLTLFSNFNNAMSLVYSCALYRSCVMTREIGTSIGLDPSSTEESKFKSPKCATALKNIDINNY